MGIIVVAKKELQDLLSSRGTIVILIVYTMVILSSINDVNILLSNGTVPDNQIVIMTLDVFFRDLSVYGAILSILIGFISISSEKINDSLSTLITKPLFRDTIINGKLLGCTVFVTLILLLTSVIYISLLIITIGHPFVSVLINFLDRAIIIFLLVMIYIVFFTCLSMAITIVVENQGTALLTSSVLFIFLSFVIPNVSFAGNLSLLFNENENMVRYLLTFLSPGWTLNTVVYGGLIDPSVDVLLFFKYNYFEFIKLLLSLLIVMLTNYFIFLRSDVR